MSRANPGSNVVSLSGGKDSTAMLLLMLEKGIPVDEIVFFDTGWEFPQILRHIARLEKDLGIPVHVLTPKRPFNHLLHSRKVVRRFDSPHGPKGEHYRTGYGWPSMVRRWCTQSKIDALDLFHHKTDTRFIGIAADESSRTHKRRRARDTYPIRYPLIEFGVTEPEALEICYSHGYDFEGIYHIFKRVSCFCCPLQRIGELRNLFFHFPDLWQRMLDMDRQVPRGQHNFKKGKTVADLHERFCKECAQLSFDEADHA